jgi:hypothetical protein
VDRWGKRGIGKIGTAFASSATVRRREEKTGRVVVIAYRSAIIVADPVVFAAPVAREGLSSFQCAAETAAV